MSREAELAEDDRIDGKSRVGPNPAAVALNGVVASAGVMELIAAITELRPINRHLESHADGKLIVDKSLPRRIATTARHCVPAGMKAHWSAWAHHTLRALGAFRRFCSPAAAP